MISEHLHATLGAKLLRPSGGQAIVTLCLHASISFSMYFPLFLLSIWSVQKNKVVHCKFPSTAAQKEEPLMASAKYTRENDARLT